MRAGDVGAGRAVHALPGRRQARGEAPRPGRGAAAPGRAPDRGMPALSSAEAPQGGEETEENAAGRETLELTIAELGCADEAQQIEGAFEGGGGGEEGRPAGRARRAIVAYDAARVTPEAIRETVRALGMTV